MCQLMCRFSTSEIIEASSMCRLLIPDVQSVPATERGMGFFAKKEMEKVPLLSTWMKRLHCLFLDRNDLKQGLKTILTAIEKVKSGISICIFPEGTRNKNEDELDMLPFHEGSFKIAAKAN